MIKTISSKTAWLLALAISFLGLAALVVWAQVAQAQTSSVVRIDSARQMFGDHDDDDDTPDESYLKISISVPGSNRLAPVTEDDGNYGKYEISTVEDRDDCNEDDFDKSTDFSVEETFKIKNTVTGRYDNDASEIFSGLGSAHDDKHLCMKVSYLDADEDFQTDYVSSSVVLDVAPPEVEDVLVKGARNQDYGSGDNIDVVVTFSERVFVKKISEDTGDDLMRPTLNLGNNRPRSAELNSLSSGTTLTFRYTVGFDDPTVAALQDEASTVITLGNDYKIVDAAGNEFTGTAAEEIDFPSGSGISVELMVEAVRMTDNRLVVKATPMEYDDNDDGTDNALTVKSAVVWSSEDAPNVRSNQDPCEDGVKVDGSETAANKLADYHGVTLPDDPNDEYYCFEVTDAKDRITYTNVHRYVEDTSRPRIGFNNVDNEATITAVDAESGIKSASPTWFWLIGDDNSTRCDNRTPSSKFNESDDTFEVLSSYGGDRICVRAENNAGLKRTQAFTVKYDADVDMEEEEEEDDDDDTVVDPGDAEDVDDGDDDDDDDMESTEGKTKVPKAWPGQAAWDQAVADGRAGVVNPWGCVDDTKIGRERGMCLSGGTTLMDDDYVYVDGYDDAGDGSSATPAPGSDDTSTTTTPPGTTTTAPDPGDAGDPGTDDGSTDDGSTDSGDATVAEGASSDVISLTYSYDDASDMVKVSLDESVTATAQYVVQEDGNSCDETGVDTATAQDVGADDDGDLVIQVDEAAVEAGHYVCVFVAMTDADGNEDMDYQVQQVGEDATAGTDDGASGDGDDEGGSNSLWIIIAIVGILIVGVVVVLLFSGKRNS